MAKRNRVIYQSEALFVSAQYSGHNTIDIIDGSHHGAGVNPSIEPASFHQIHRVQSANYNFAISRTDVNQFGSLARIDSAVIEAPTVGLDFSFLVTDGTNEDKLGITVDSTRDLSAVSGILSNISGRNYHILTTAEGTDANDKSGGGTDTSSTVISIGNGFVTNYSMNAAIGSIPSASVSVEGLNITAQPSTSNLGTPAMNSSNSTAGTATFTLPDAAEGSVGDILRPGDMEINLGDATGLLANFADTSSANGAHIQSFSIDVPLGRSVINRLGNAFGFSKEVDFPVTVSCSISAIVADLKAGNLFDELYSTAKHDMNIIMRKPAAGGGAAGVEQIRYKLKGVVLDSESFSSSIGDNKTVDLSFSATVGGPEDTTNGLFISGTSVSTAVKSAT
jgi:hypothetical protein